MNVTPFRHPQWEYPGIDNWQTWHSYWYPYYTYGQYDHRQTDRYPSAYSPIELKDFGGKPFVVNIERAAKQNQNYRTVIWTGKHLQVVLMSIEAGGDIGLEVHPDVDQFIRIEQGRGLVMMGDRRDRLDFQREVSDDDAIMIPAGTWHNVINTGRTPIKLYTLYAPPEHPFGTVQRTKAEAMAAAQK
jgi:mannose-6-phosphate isomerase-like protein (cupin superfamily)